MSDEGIVFLRRKKDGSDMRKIIRIPWTEEQEKFLIECWKKRMHPIDIVEAYNARFDLKRNHSMIDRKMRRLGLPFHEFIPKKEIQRLKEMGDARPSKKMIQEVRKDVERLKLQQKLGEYRTKYQYLVRERSLEDRVLTAIREECRALPRVEMKWEAPSGGVSSEEASLLLGDLHLGERISRDEVHGFGEYNFEIFTKRIKFLARTIKNITIRKLTGYRVDRLHVLGLGDMVSGIIHDELKENAESLMFQIINGAYVVAQFILELSQLFQEISIDGVLGNHGRISKKRYYKRRYTNWDFIFYQFLGTFLSSNERIKCNFPKSFFLVKKIYDWNFLVLHGDNIRSWFGIPWYGIERAMWRLGDLLQGKGVRIHYRVLGHFHKTGELDRAPGEILINGSFSGGSEYSLGAMFEFDRPTQLFFGIHKDIGVSWRYPLRLDLPEVEEVEPYEFRMDLDAAKYMREFLERKESQRDAPEWSSIGNETENIEDSRKRDR